MVGIAHVTQAAPGADPVDVAFQKTKDVAELKKALSGIQTTDERLEMSRDIAISLLENVPATLDPTSCIQAQRKIKLGNAPPSGLEKDEIKEYSLVMKFLKTACASSPKTRPTTDR